MSIFLHETFRYVDSSGHQFDMETYLDQLVDTKSIKWIKQDTITFEENLYTDIAIVKLLSEKEFIIEKMSIKKYFWGYMCMSKIMGFGIGKVVKPLW